MLETFFIVQQQNKSLSTELTETVRTMQDYGYLAMQLTFLTIDPTVFTQLHPIDLLFIFMRAYAKCLEHK